MKRILSYSPVVRNSLQVFIGQQKEVSRTAPTPKWQNEFFDRLLPYATSGKLLRGCLVCFSYESLSGQPPDADVLNVAAALELTHSALLIHDDVMDGDNLRRGRPAFHSQYQAIGEAGSWRDPTKFGENMALCAGDVAVFLAFELLNKSTESHEARATVQHLFSDQLIRTCFGQMQDIATEACADTPSRQAVHDLMQSKTAAYTISLPLAIGAALAGKSKKTIEALKTFGLAAGTIFQIRDDELGVLGDPSQTGKPVGADIREGKKTLVYCHLLKRCSSHERRLLQEIFGNSECTNQEIAHVQQLIKKYEISACLEEDILMQKKHGMAALEQLDASEETRDELRNLLAFCARRQN